MAKFHPFYYSLLLSIMRMTFRTLTKFEHRAITISAQISAYSINHVIGIYVYMYICIYEIDNLFDRQC